ASTRPRSAPCAGAPTCRPPSPGAPCRLCSGRRPRRYAGAGRPGGARRSRRDRHARPRHLVPRPAVEQPPPALRGGAAPLLEEEGDAVRARAITEVLDPCDRLPRGWDQTPLQRTARLAPDDQPIEQQLLIEQQLQAALALRADRAIGSVDVA